MAVVSLLGTATFTTTSGTKTVTATPAVGDLLVIVTAHSGSTASVAPTDDKGGTYTLINSTFRATSVDTMRIYVRDSLVSSAVSTIYTHAPGTTTGGGLAVFKVTGMTRVGAAAVRQSTAQSNAAAAATPNPTFASAVLTANPVIAVMFNAASPPTVTPKTGYTEAFDAGYATPTTGWASMFRSSGETGTAITWATASATAFGALAVELDTSAMVWPAPIATGFEEYTSSAQPSDWTVRYTTTGHTFTTTDDGAGGKFLRNDITTAGFERLLSWNQFDGIVGGSDVELVTRTRTSDIPNYQSSIYLRGSGATTAAQTTYNCQLQNQTLNVSKYVNGPWTAISAPAFTYSANQWIWIRFRINGTTIQAKAWADGTAEPGSWMVSVTDTSILGAGWAGVGGYNNNGSRDYDYVCIASGGQTAPLPIVMDQSSFRLYEDGTESGSTAIAAQNTNITRLVASNSNLALRLRLQESAGGTGNTTDDYQLQYRKNGGSYQSIASSDILVDSYSETNQSTGEPLNSAAAGQESRAGQSFTSTGGKLKSAKFYLLKSASPTGNATAELYAHTGTFGAGGTGTGTALAVSDPFDVSTLTTSYQLITFNFTGANQYDMVSGTNYVIVVNYTSGNTSNFIRVGEDNTTPTHVGNMVYFISGTTWGALTSTDACFYVYTAIGADVIPYASASLTDAGATTNRLGAGSGSFVAGEVSETGLVTDHQLTGLNYTEHLYSLTLVASALADGDTLDFRVIRNGSVLSAYSYVPRITAQKVVVNTITKTHFADANKRKATVVSHYTDANKKRAYTASHTTDANKKKSVTQFHTTDSQLLRSAASFTRTHTADANKKRPYSVIHTTSANKKVAGFTKTHTTDSFLRRQLTLSHTTSSSKRRAYIVSQLTDALKKKAYTKTHTTDALKRLAITKTHLTDALKRVRAIVSHTTSSFLSLATKNYSREARATLPTGDANLATVYSYAEWATVDTVNSVYVGLGGGPGYLLHQYKNKTPDNSYSISLGWTGRSSVSASIQPVYLQIYNRTTTTWDTVDSNTTTAANTNFTLTSTIETNLSNYYDVNGWVSARVWRAV